ncbi:MAG: MFS transporter [Chloroflexi bacterium]|nr:MFS transporter [Chloroflexota bacterium]
MLAAYRMIASNRNLVRLFFGEFVSGIGDWLYLVALLVIVYRESSDPVLLGIVGGARIIPYIVLSVPAGILIDRIDRRLILIVTDIIRGLAMVGLALVTFLHGPVWLIVGLAIFATCFAVFFRPSIGAYLPSLVRNESELGPANSVFATLGEITFIIGPAIGGLIIATTDLGWAFVINALSFLGPVLVLWSLPPNRPGVAPAAARADAMPAASEDASGGLAADADAPRKVAPDVAAATPPITLRNVIRPVAGIAVLNVVSGFFWGGLSVALVILAVDQLGAGEDATGYLWAAIGVGGVVGAVGSSWVTLRPNLGPALLVGAAVLGAGFVFLGLATDLAAALVAMVIVASGALLADIVNTTVLQRIVPDVIRGRTLGVLQTATTLTYAAGSFLVPVLMTTLGAEVLLPVGGVLIFGASLVTFALVGPSFRRTPAADAVADSLGRVARLPLFAGVSPAALELAAQRLVPVPVTAGMVVIREGGPADRFYIIESGRFAVDQRDPGTGLQRRLRVMGPDEVFGELGLMNHVPRSATVSAETDGRLLALDGADFLELLSAGPEVSARMLERYRTPAVPMS